MKKIKLSDIVGIINKIAPPRLAESWDNSGLQVGDQNAEINRIMVALDPTPAVIDNAITSSCQLLVTHHPLIFKPQKTVSCATQQGKMIHAAIKGDLAIISIHTSYDVAAGGLNDLLAQRLEIGNCSALQITSQRELVKLVVFVPEGHLEQMRAALLPHAENLGLYRDCSFATGGEGTFTPVEGANPFIGTIGAQERVREERLELLICRSNLPRALKTMLAAHPYEEPAFDIYPLLNEGEGMGLGRIGLLSHPAPLEEFAAQVRERLRTQDLRYVGDPGAMVNRVAICSGSGASLLMEAVRAGADCLVTGDVKYHEARDAEELGIALIDAGHFPSEHIMVQGVTGQLRQMLDATGYHDCEVLPCLMERDPFRYIHAY